VSAPLELGAADHPATSLRKFFQNPNVQRKFREMMSTDLELDKAPVNRRRRGLDKTASDEINAALAGGANACDVAILFGHPFDLVIDRTRRLVSYGKSEYASFKTPKEGHRKYAKKRLDALKLAGKVAPTFELPPEFFGQLKN
jgi:hypothetical protein